jgi:hypothetical protein
MTHGAAARTEYTDFSRAGVGRSRSNGRVWTRDTPRKRALLEVLEGADGFSALPSFIAASARTWLLGVWG